MSASSSRNQPEDSNSAGSGGAVWALGAAIVCLALLTLYWGFAGDDTFIYLQYARNIAQGDGFSFNAGEPSYGTTGPVWALLVAGAWKIAGGDLYLIAKLLGFVFTALAIWAFHGLARHVLQDGWLAAVAAFALAFDPWLLKWGGSGMETPLSLLIVFLATRLYLRECERGGFPLWALLLGLGTLVRPELIALFLIFVFDRIVLISPHPGAGNRWRVTAAAIVLYVIPLAPWFLYAHAQFGDVVAATIHAKSGYTSRWEVVVRTVKIIGSGYGAALVVAVAGLIAFCRGRGGFRYLVYRLATTRLLWAWVIALPAAYFVTMSYVASRYLLIATPFILLLGFWGIAKLTNRAHRYASIILAVLAVSSVLVQATVIYPRTRFERGVDGNFIAVAEWVRDNTPTDALVAVHEVGAIGYFCERRIVDTAGLVTSVSLPYVLEKRHADLFRDLEPDYYVSSGDIRIDRFVFDPFGDRMTKLFEREIQRGGSSDVFSMRMPIGVYAMDWSAPIER